MPKKRLDVEARVSVKDDGSKNIKKIDSGFKRLTKTIKTSALAQVAAFAGVAIAVRGLVRGIGRAITAANQQADAINALEGALAPLGKQVDKISLSLQKQAAALQKVTTFGDETIIEAQAMIASFVKEEDAIKAATVATIDLAEAKGFDLVAAADLVSKTLGSSTNALTRYGIEVTGAVGSTERLTSLTENVAKVFGGRATKATETFSGKVKQLGNAWGDLLERVGEAVTENEGANKSIDDLTKSVNEIAPSVAKFAVLVLKLATGFVKVTAAIFEFQAKIVTFIPKLIGVNKATEDTALSMDAMARSAAAQGISIEELKRRIDANVGANRLLGDRTREAAAAMEEAKEKTDALAESQKKLDEETSAAATALEKLAASLGTVSSAEIAAEIAELEANLETARVETGGFGREFEKLAETATEKIGVLKETFNRLQEGLGETREAAEETAETVDDLGETLEDTGGAAEDTGVSMETLGGSLNKTTEDIAALSAGVGVATDKLKAVHAQAVFTSQAFDNLSDSAGRAAAVSAALNAGGTLTQGGTRVRVRSGSRLTNISGRTTYNVVNTGSMSAYSLSPFGTGGKVTVDPNGDTRPD